MTEGEKGLLLRCFAGCTIKEITEKLGLRVSDLFFDAGVPDLAERQRARHRRAQERAAQQATYGAEGRRLDALREAEYLVSATRGITIDGWSNDKLDAMLNTLAAAYMRIWEDSDEWR